MILSKKKSFLDGQIVFFYGQTEFPYFNFPNLSNVASTICTFDNIQYQYVHIVCSKLISSLLNKKRLGLIGLLLFCVVRIFMFLQIGKMCLSYSAQ